MTYYLKLKLSNQCLILSFGFNIYLLFIWPLHTTQGKVIWFNFKNRGIDISDGCNGCRDQTETCFHAIFECNSI